MRKEKETEKVAEKTPTPFSRKNSSEWNFMKMSSPNPSPCLDVAQSFSLNLKGLNMAQNWLVAVDDSAWASYAFNYAAEFMHKKNDHLYLMHVMEEPARVFIGYATPNLIDSMQKLMDEKARKILVHYGHKAKDLGVRPFPVFVPILPHISYRDRYFDLLRNLLVLMALRDRFNTR